MIPQINVNQLLIFLKILELQASKRKICLNMCGKTMLNTKNYVDTYKTEFYPVTCLYFFLIQRA